MPEEFVSGMSLIKMVVTNALGQTFLPATGETEEDQSLIGYCGYVYFDSEKKKKDPYHFWAIEVPDRTNLQAHQISMVMPLGGVYSGLYRYPKIGEQVLVAAQASGGNTEYYMMGYVPSEDNPFGSTEASERVIEEEGELLRYNNTAYGENLYSEMGFYRAEAAQWPIAEETEGSPPYFPPIDVLVLDSAGNIRETAWNHHLQKAARIEILADTAEVIDRKTNAVDEQGTLPVGEYPGDDASLHKGDIHIRAGNRVVIKADQEIRLQVGRTTLRMDDTGFNVSTKNVAGNYTNSYDTSLDMNPRNGINMTGKNINLKAIHRFNAGDSMGGSVATTMGNLNLGGREVNMESYNNTEYMFYAIYQGLEYLVNAASGAMALDKSADIKIADYVKFSQENLEALIKLARKANALWAKRKEIVKKKDEERRKKAAAQLIAEQEEAERQQLEAEERRKIAEAEWEAALHETGEEMGEVLAEEDQRRAQAAEEQRIRDEEDLDDDAGAPVRPAPAPAGDDDDAGAPVEPAPAPAADDDDAAGGGPRAPAADDDDDAAGGPRAPAAPIADDVATANAETERNQAMQELNEAKRLARSLDGVTGMTADVNSKLRQIDSAEIRANDAARRAEAAAASGDPRAVEAANQAKRYARELAAMRTSLRRRFRS
jgi:phage baseplate assembly protein gpV